MQDYRASPFLSLEYMALAGSGTEGFLWQSAPSLLAGAGPGACYCLKVWKGKPGGSEGGVQRGTRRRETGGVEAWFLRW